jgi:phage gpG-like protein
MFEISLEEATRGLTQQMANRFANASRGFMAEVSDQLAEEALNFVRDGFDKEQDPYGKKWAGRAERKKRKAEDDDDAAVVEKSTIGEKAESLGPKKRKTRKAKLKRRKRGAGKKEKQRNLLVLTGAMRKSVNVKSSASEFTVGFGQKYAKYHQEGTKKMLQRMLVPTDDKGLPDEWEKEFISVAEEVFESFILG